MLRNICNVAMLLAVLVISLSGIAQAQGWGGAATNMNAAAEVYTILTITQSTALNFGDILSTSSPSIDPTNAANDVAVGLHTGHPGYACGKFTIQGTAGKAVTITWPVSAQLNSGGNHMTWTLAVSGANADAGARGGVTVGGTTTSPNLSGTGYYYLWVGGDLGSLSGQAAGIYNGTANFVVDYN